MLAFDNQQYQCCTLCPRECHCNRLAGANGFCAESGQCRVAYIGAHFGEEPCISGQNGSGTIFFSGCSCGCFFCQNHQISQGHLGELLSPEELLEHSRNLARCGVHNLNFVTPEHFWPHIRFLCQSLRQEGYELPFLWNSSGFSKVEMLAEQSRYIDIFLPDYKFADPELAQRCMGRPDYPEIALSALRLLVDRKGFLRPFDSSGEITASCGVMVRHLVLPGQVQDTLTVLNLLHREFGSDLPLSLMRQFTPMPECHARKFLDRKVSAAEYALAADEAMRLGFRRLFLQDDDDGSFLPDFRLRQQPFAGNREHGQQPDGPQTSGNT